MFLTENKLITGSYQPLKLSMKIILARQNIIYISTNFPDYFFTDLMAIKH